MIYPATRDTNILLLTEDDWDKKVELYRKGMYIVPVPPVCHANWTEEAWIRFIDKEGSWLKS